VNARWAIKGLLRIYTFQTDHEKQAQATTDANGAGFTAFDAELLTSYADQYKAKSYLTAKQIAVLHKMMPKYAGQLYRYAKAQPKTTSAEAYRAASQGQ
jgi:hypothetical protein